MTKETPFKLLTEIAKSHGVTMKSFVECAPPWQIEAAARKLLAAGHNWTVTAHWLNATPKNIKRRLTWPYCSKEGKRLLYLNRSEKAKLNTCETAQTGA